MTILCALYDPDADELWLGCNDRATIGDTPAPASASKWLKFGDWVIGLSGDESVYEQYLQLAGEKFPLESANVLDVFKFLRQTFDDYNLGQQKSGDSAASYGVDGIIAHMDGGARFRHRAGGRPGGQQNHAGDAERAMPGTVRCQARGHASEDSGKGKERHHPARGHQIHGEFGAQFGQCRGQFADMGGADDPGTEGGDHHRPACGAGGVHGRAPGRDRGDMAAN